MKKWLRFIARTPLSENISYEAAKTLLAKLRTGKYKSLRAYKSLLDGSDPTYPLCNQEPQDLQHWLQRCQTTDWDLIFLDSVRLDCLTNHSLQEVALPRRILSSGPSEVLLLPQGTLHSKPYWYWSLFF